MCTTLHHYWGEAKGQDGTYMLLRFPHCWLQQVPHTESEEVCIWTSNVNVHHLPCYAVIFAIRSLIWWGEQSGWSRGWLGLAITLSFQWLCPLEITTPSFQLVVTPIPTHPSHSLETKNKRDAAIHSLAFVQISLPPPWFFLPSILSPWSPAASWALSWQRQDGKTRQGYFEPKRPKQV